MTVISAYSRSAMLPWCNMFMKTIYYIHIIIYMLLCSDIVQNKYPEPKSCINFCYYPIGYFLSKSTTASTITTTTCSSSTSAQSLKPTATDVFQRLHASHAEAGQKEETVVTVMNLIVERERCHAKIHGAPVVEIDLKKSTIAKERERV